MKKLLIIFMMFFGTLLLAQTEQVKLLQEYLESFFSGNFEKTFEMQNEQVKSAFTVEKIKQSYESITQNLGNFESVYSTNIVDQEPYTVYVQILKTDQGYIKSTVTFDQNDLVAGFFIAPAKDPRSTIDYIDQEKFVEKEISFGKEGWKLNGALTLPDTDEKVPLIIIVGGSGPTDMNASIGANTPYRDIAYGLSSNGIAVLRYNKRTAQYGREYNQALQEGASMINTEYIEDITEAVRFASQLEEVSSIILAGHSLGGAIVPYMATQLEEINGVMLLAPAVRRMAQVSLDQNIYLKDVYSITDEQIEQVTQFFNMILNHELPEDYVIQPGITASFYYEWDKYRPEEDLELLNLPVLVMIGEEDFQATVEGDFNPLKARFGDNKRFEFHSFKGLNHLFMKTEEGIVHTTEEYNKSGFVDEKIIQTIVKWVENNF
ncbi:MAG TPA: alpha/beta hydrolase [Thermotogota bacterium]|nr:alpha/beta hydrolase [Thermotogota bacterium]HPJ89005.1 alpha/beta hydrolase [Thermotogota bacterium]HPR95516.1 alpha/beta hydrolase [Thermotogota bacterium]